MIVAQDHFRDEELFQTRAAIEGAGHSCVVASHSPGLCSGTRGGTANADTSIDDVDVRLFDAVVFVGGPGARSFFTNSTALRIAREANRAAKVVAAICIAPVVLANAGLLRGKHATAFSSETPLLEQAGAAVQRPGVVTDGNIVTASGPEVARAFGMAIVRALSHASRAVANHAS
jgi:protease I